MYLDALLKFNDAQAVTAAADSTDIVDLGTARDIGTGQDLYLVTIVKVAMTDAGSDSAITVALQGDSTETITPDGTQDLYVFPAVSPVGTVKYAKLDPGSAPLQFQYVNVNYSPSNGSLTTGSFTSFITTDIDKYVAYPNAYTVS